MTEQEAKEYMENEILCIRRAETCDRDCGKCELVKETELLIEAYGAAIKALERQIEVNNMALIQSHRKCVLGRDEMYSDSTLQSMSKAELISLLHTAQHNYSVLLETFDGRVKYYEKELDAMSDEIKFEEE